MLPCMQGELMVATDLFAANGDSPRLSRMTLAFLEVGWRLGLI